MNTMKYFLASLLLVAATVTFAQEEENTALRVAHINSNELLMIMPERDSIQKELEAYKVQLETQLRTMSTEYEAKVAEYQQNQQTWPEIVKQSKVKEITEIEGRIGEFQQSAQGDLQTKEQQLIAPLLDRAEKAIKEVAEANGYTYVLDTSSGSILYFPDSLDLLPQVKKHLQIP